MTPDLTFRSATEGKAVVVKIESVQWLGQRCRVVIQPAAEGLFADLRSKPNDPKTSITQAKPFDKDGKAGLLVEDENLAGTATSVVVFDATGRCSEQTSHDGGRRSISMTMDDLDKLGASAFQGYLVRKDLVRKYSRQYPVPTYVVEFLLGRYCATTDEKEIEEGLQIVERQLKDRTVRTGEEELFKARAREKGSVKLIDIIKARLDAKNDCFRRGTAEPRPEGRAD